MSLTKQILDDAAHAEELERGVVEYGEVDPPYYEDEWPGHEEMDHDSKYEDYDHECADNPNCPPWTHDHEERR